MKNFTFSLLALFVGLAVSAQEYTTPDTGVNWTLDDLVQESPGTISFDNGTYTLSQDLNIAESDTLSLISALTLEIDEDVRITVAGHFFSQTDEDNPIIITASDDAAPYDGFWFEEESEVAIDHTTIEYGGGLKVITPDFTLTNSMLAYNVAGASTGAAVSLSNGSPLIENNTFLENDMPAVGSGANQEVSAHILNNLMEKNGQANENRPQLNMGPTGPDTLKIVENTIIGDRDMDMVGGIAISNFIGGDVLANIDDNTVVDNRYGITVAGGAFVNIRGNIIEDNDTQGQPNLGGSGISLNSSNDNQTIIATSNEFRRNLWGITVIGEASINLGDDADNPGNNVFSENGNSSEIFALYNNTPNTIMAKHNCWIEGQENTLEDAASVIFDVADDASLGEVIYDPVNCEGLSTPDVTKTAIAIYPNPAKNTVHFNTTENFESVSIFSLRGRLVSQESLSPGQNTLSIDLSSGLYILRFENQGQQVSKKLVVKAP